jgi:hypothetical protein
VGELPTPVAEAREKRLLPVVCANDWGNWEKCRTGRRDGWREVVRVDSAAMAGLNGVPIRFLEVRNKLDMADSTS